MHYCRQRDWRSMHACSMLSRAESMKEFHIIIQFLENTSNSDIYRISMKENVLLSNSKTLLCLYHLFESKHCQREMNSQRERNSRRSIVDQNTTERGTNMELSQYAQRPSHNMNPLDLVEINREKKENFLFNILTVLSQDRS